MSHARLMQRLAKWHIWLGWLVGVPLLLWTLSGFAMVLRPIEVVRGENLRIAAPPRAIPADAPLIARLGRDEGVTQLTQRWEGDDLVAIFTFADGRETRYSLTRKTATGGSYGASQAREDRLAVHLAGAQQRQGVDLPDLARRPRPGVLEGDPVAQLGLRGGPDDHGDDPVAPLLVGDAEHLGLLDPRVLAGAGD